MRMVLKFLRRIFPFQSAYHPGKKICLYNHLGLCPCPGTLDADEKKKQYKITVSYIKDFLGGKTKKVIQELEKERDGNIKAEYFEDAAVVQHKIDAIKLITSPVNKPFDYESNPNLREDLRIEELKQLAEILTQNGEPVSLLTRLECFDISTISGVFSTGSMVVFTNGEKDSSQYRRFKIRQKQKIGSPNDFLMMKEVIQRRMQHAEWQAPNLIIVDGGKGQVSSALSILKLSHNTIPLIGLAKREETIITSSLKEISLPKNSPALRLIMRIRDEAHRFAIFYHRKLRKKFTLL